MADIGGSDDPIQQETILRQLQIELDRQVHQRKENDFKLFTLKQEVKRMEKSIQDIDKEVVEKQKKLETLRAQFAQAQAQK